MSILSFVLVGFLLGLRHATDADHVLAVSTIVTRERSVRAALRLGLLWGAGHTLTLALVGGLLLAFGIVIPTTLGEALEALVGLMLVALGVWALLGVFRAAEAAPAQTRHLREHAHDALAGGSARGYVRSAQAPSAGLHMHVHVHVHGDYVHSHAHGHTPQTHGHVGERTPARWLDARLGRWPWYQWLRPLAIGVVHGLAGSASVVLLIMASTRELASALLYLFAFGLGTLAGMAVLTSAMAAPLALAARRMPRFGQGVRALAGAASVAFGIFMIAQLSAASHWWAPVRAPGTLSSHGGTR